MRLEDIWDGVTRSGAMTDEQRLTIRLASTWAIQQAREAVTALYLAAGALAMRNLGRAGARVEARARPYALARALVASGARAIAAMAVPETGLGAAINDRLRRAAAPRPPEC